MSWSYGPAMWKICQPCAKNCDFYMQTGKFMPAYFFKLGNIFKTELMTAQEIQHLNVSN